MHLIVRQSHLRLRTSVFLSDGHLRLQTSVCLSVIAICGGGPLVAICLWSATMSADPPYLLNFLLQFHYLLISNEIELENLTMNIVNKPFNLDNDYLMFPVYQPQISF